VDTEKGQKWGDLNRWGDIAQQQEFRMLKARFPLSEGVFDL